jgi:hypothetical protein
MTTLTEVFAPVPRALIAATDGQYVEPGVISLKI